MKIRTGSRTILALLGVAFAVVISACSPDVSMTNRGPSRELQACAKGGGTLQARGKLRTPVCVHPYSDAGRNCSGKADCKGRCIAEPGENGLPQAGTAVIGHCQADDRLFGCYAEVEGGKAKGGICVD